MLTADANLFYTIDSASRLTAKAHDMRGRHQLPGPVQYYTQMVSAEQTEEEVAFVQVKWNVERGKWKVQLLGKVQSLYDMWEDSAANTASGYQCNTYLQREAYGSVAASRKLGRGFSLNLAADGSLSRLLNNKEYCNDVLRRSLIGVGEVRYSHGPLDVRMHLLGTTVSDRVSGKWKVESGELSPLTSHLSPHYRRLSPYVGAFLTVGEGTTLRLFYKEVYRVPNFGELYFFPEDTVPHNLRPEKARQLNLGVTYCGQWSAASGQLTVD
jgi:outer membrane receptor protein involved in Fe transport